MTVFKKNKKIKITEDNGKFILVDSLSGFKHILNGPSMRLWEMFGNGKSSGSIIQLYKKEYPRIADSVISNLIIELLRRDLLKSVLDNFFILNFKFLKQEIDDKDKIVIYFPEKKTAICIDRKYIEYLEKLAAGLEGTGEQTEKGIIEFLTDLGLINQPTCHDEYLSYYTDEPTRLTILPSNNCSMRCVYCYASAGINKRELIDWTTVKETVDWISKNALEAGEDTLSVSFMGGGEPSTNWPILIKTVEYVRGLGKKNNLKTIINLTTNGVLSENQAEWVAKNIEVVKLSFDGPADIQNMQRPLKNGGESFPIVYRTAKIFDRFGVYYIPRATITSKNVKRIEDIVNFFIDNFQLVSKTIIINPVYLCGSCATHNVDHLGKDEFEKNIFRARANIKDRNLNIVTPHDKLKTSPIPKMPYCGFQKGNCFLTADGYLSTCSEVDNMHDDRSPLFFFGKYEKESNVIKINEKKKKQLYDLQNSPKKCCTGCRLNIFCSGPCLVRGLEEKTAGDILKKYSLDPVSEIRDEDIDKILSVVGFNQEAKLQCDIAGAMFKNQLISAFQKDGGECTFNFLKITPKTSLLINKMTAISIE